MLDDDAAEYTGAWKVGEKLTPLVGTSYRHDDRAKKSFAVAKFRPEIPADGKYEVRLLYVHASNRAQKAQITIRSADGEKVVTQNQCEACLEDGIPRSLGVFAFTKGKAGTIAVSNAGADGYVVVDGLQLVPEAEATVERNTRAESGFPIKTSALSVPVKIPPPMKCAAKPQDVKGKSYDLVVIGGWFRNGLQLPTHPHPRSGDRSLFGEQPGSCLTQTTACTGNHDDLFRNILIHRFSSFDVELI